MHERASLVARAIAGALLLLGSGCDAFYMVRGTVRRCSDGRPIAGAHVVLRYPGEHGAADADRAGRFRVAVNDPPGDNPARLTAVAPGYRERARTVHHSVDEEQGLCLEPAP